MAGRVLGLAVASILVVGCLAFLAVYGVILAPFAPEPGQSDRVESDSVKPDSGNTPMPKMRPITASDYAPEMIFRTLVIDPIPASVRDIEGDALTWQGYQACLKFTANDADIDAIIARGFSRASWEAISARFALPPGLEDLQDA